MTARSDARGDDAQYRDPRTFTVGDRVRCHAGTGVIEFVAYSNAMQSPVFTVAIDSRIKLRLTARDIIPEHA